MLKVRHSVQLFIFLPMLILCMPGMIAILTFKTANTVATKILAFCAHGIFQTWYITFRFMLFLNIWYLSFFLFKIFHICYCGITTLSTSSHLIFSIRFYVLGVRHKRVVFTVFNSLLLSHKFPSCLGVHLYTFSITFWAALLVFVLLLCFHIC